MQQWASPIFSISGFIQPENIRKSKTNMIIHYSSIARSEDPLICLLLLRENRCALVNFTLACNMMWGGALAYNVSLSAMEDTLCQSLGQDVWQQPWPAYAVE